VAIKTKLTGFGTIGVYTILLLEIERNNCPILLNQVATCNYIYIGDFWNCRISVPYVWW